MRKFLVLASLVCACDVPTPSLQPVFPAQAEVTEPAEPPAAAAISAITHMPRIDWQWPERDRTHVPYTKSGGVEVAVWRNSNHVALEIKRREGENSTSCSTTVPHATGSAVRVVTTINHRVDVMFRDSEELGVTSVDLDCRLLRIHKFPRQDWSGVLRRNERGNLAEATSTIPPGFHAAGCRTKVSTPRGPLTMFGVHAIGEGLESECGAPVLPPDDEFPIGVIAGLRVSEDPGAPTEFTGRAATGEIEWRRTFGGSVRSRWLASGDLEVQETRMDALGLRVEKHILDPTSGITIATLRMPVAIAKFVASLPTELANHDPFTVKRGMVDYGDYRITSSSERWPYLQYEVYDKTTSDVAAAGSRNAGKRRGAITTAVVDEQLVVVRLFTSLYGAQRPVETVEAEILDLATGTLRGTWRLDL